ARDRAEEDRGREGGVDDREEAVLAGEARGGGEIADAAERVGDRLDVKDARRRLEARRPAGWILQVDEVVADPEAREVARQEIVGAAVDAVLHEDVVAGAEEGEERRADRGHSARGDEGALAP